MAWRQLVTPLTGTVGQAGWCLVYVRNAFGAPAGYASAQISWNAAVARGTAHADRNFPSGVSFPVYFSFGSDGHVVWYNAPDGLYYSSPTSGYGHQTFTTIAAIEQWLARLGGRFIGWAEDVNTRRVIQFEADAPASSPASGINWRRGAATVTAGPLNVRNEPNPAAASQAQYINGQVINYDGWIDGAQGFRYLTYVSFSGVRRYVAQSGPGGTYVSGGV